MKRILVIDDDEIVDEMLVQLPAEAGHEPESARGIIGGEQYLHLAILIGCRSFSQEANGYRRVLGCRAKAPLGIPAVSGDSRKTCQSHTLAGFLCLLFATEAVAQYPLDMVGVLRYA
jgi:hypothetical protein